MTEPRYLMLSPITEPNWVPGAVEVTADCGHQAWISPSGLMLQLGGGITTKCQNCVDPDEVTEIETVPGGREELVALLGGEEAVDQLLREARRDPADTVRVLQAQSRRRQMRRR